MSTRFMTADETAALDKWYVIDANDQVLGRIATKAATRQKPITSGTLLTRRTL